MLAFAIVFAACTSLGQAVLRAEFSTEHQANDFIDLYLEYEDHLKGGNINSNFEFIQMFISKDFVCCFGGECTFGRDAYIQSKNSMAGIIKDWSLTLSVVRYGKKYLSFVASRYVTYANDEELAIFSSIFMVLNDDGSIKVMTEIPSERSIGEEMRQVTERNSGVQSKDDL